MIHTLLAVGISGAAVAGESAVDKATGTPVAILVLLAIIAIIPGCWAALVSGRTRRDMRNKDAERMAEGEGRVGVQFAQTAFKQLQEEVDGLRRERKEWQLEREKWSQEREKWHADRLKLLTKIEALNFQISKLRQALQAAGVNVPDLKVPDGLN